MGLSVNECSPVIPNKWSLITIPMVTESSAFSQTKFTIPYLDLNLLLHERRKFTVYFRESVNMLLKLP